MSPLEKMVSDIPKRGAVAGLIGYCEGICESGILGETAELHLRELIARALSAFDMPSKTERESADA